MKNKVKPKPTRKELSSIFPETMCACFVLFLGLRKNFHPNCVAEVWEKSFEMNKKKKKKRKRSNLYQKLKSKGREIAKNIQKTVGTKTP